MNLSRTLVTGLRGILGHRLRSLLTTLGILFGVAAVISTVGIGQASADSVNSRIAALGSNLLTVSGGSTAAAGIRGGAGSANTLTMSDVAGLRDPGNAPDIAAVAPVVQARASLQSGGTNWSTTVSGSSPEWLTTNARTIDSGSMFDDSDVQRHAHVMVLGSTTAQQLGVGVGDQVIAGSAPFTVVGILATIGGQGFQNQDDLAVIPLTAAHDVVTGGDANSVQRILLSAGSANDVGSAYIEADDLLLQTHHIADAASADFTITPQASILATAQSITTTLTILLASVAAISLLVGGIGVMNIMLVSVTERTGEIGLRKALGATPRDVLRQFLVEAATLSLVGGVLGVAAAVAASVILPKFTTIAMTITAAPVLIAVAVAAGVGLVFGVYPAVRASRLAPIDALRAQ